MKAAVAVAVALAGCADPGSGATRKDCEAVLAHLVVLESDTTPVVCRFHHACGGDDEAKFLAACPEVLSRRELGCYQRATTVAAADACLDRVALAARIDTGVVEPTDDYEGWTWEQSPVRRALGKLRILKDEACGCRDAACADRVEQRFQQLSARWEARGEKPSQLEEREGERIYAQYTECLRVAAAAY